MQEKNVHPHSSFEESIRVRGGYSCPLRLPMIHPLHLCLFFETPGLGTPPQAKYYLSPSITSPTLTKFQLFLAPLLIYWLNRHSVELRGYSPIPSAHFLYLILGHLVKFISFFFFRRAALPGSSALLRIPQLPFFGLILPVNFCASNNVTTSMPRPVQPIKCCCTCSCSRLCNTCTVWLPSCLLSRNRHCILPSVERGVQLLKSFRATVTLQQQCCSNTSK